jgi:hypothetical protein
MGLHSFQTMRLSFEQICQGQNPWVPLGNFMNDWYELHRECQEQLIADPLPEQYPSEFHYWAVFCAASVEWFAHKYGVVCPSWVYAPHYTLVAPQFSSEKEALRAYYVASTPAEFTRRNIFCGDRMFANKWEALDGFMERRERRRRASAS